MMEREIETIKAQAEQAINEASTLDKLDAVRVKYLGKKGELTYQLKKLGQLAPEDRPVMGQRVNEVKQTLQSMIEKRRVNLEHQALNQRLAEETCDVTLPGRRRALGASHPLMRVRQRADQILSSMGFESVSGPEIEDDYHNFEALNTPEYHPARAMQATFYFDSGFLLRTHTSSVQIRAMKKRKPPMRIMAHGRVYRRDLDPTHTPMFHQLEGLWVDEAVTFAELKGVMTEFLKTFFDQDLNVRFRPSYFPFTEPSAEVDIECLHCQGENCSVCKGQGWLEVLGCGMVDPEVFQSVSVPIEQYRGFAFGMGLDRLAMLQYGITDIRLLFENDIRFLEQFHYGAPS